MYQLRLSITNLGQQCVHAQLDRGTTGSSVISSDDQILLSLVEQLTPEHTDVVQNSFRRRGQRRQPEPGGRPAMCRRPMPGRELAAAAYYTGLSDWWG
jgi:hypothetical protein